MDDRLLVLNRDDDCVSVVDPETGETVEEIETDFDPITIETSPDGTKSYVTCAQGNALNVIDNETFSVTGRIEHDLLDHPSGLAVRTRANELWLVSRNNSRVFVFDIETDEGVIQTDDRARTPLDHIFAVGDVAGDPMLAHKAFKEGEVAAEVIAGEPSALDYQAVPAAVFTDPEIGTVGMTEAEAEAAGYDPVVGQMPLRASGRALTLNEREGFVRVVADDETGFLLGAQIVGPDASELVAELAVAIELGATLEDVAATIHIHPTLGEAVHEAVKGARNESIHY